MDKKKKNNIRIVKGGLHFQFKKSIVSKEN